MLMLTCAVLGSFIAFTVSASAGLGGSLVLIPILVILFGVKQGIALAALLLAANNVAKVIAYRNVVPFKATALVVLMTIVGAALGARLLIAAPETLVHAAVIASLAATLVAEYAHWSQLQRLSAPVLGLFAGMTSGFSGTSGPLKGVALRNLKLDRQHLVGAASVVSLAGDATKAAVLTKASVIDGEAFWILVLALPLMPVATLIGRQINRRMGERAYAALFWTVMAGYTGRLLLA